jgi:hypothetical protein
VEEEAREALGLGVPGGEREPAAWAEDARELGAHGREVGHVSPNGSASASACWNVTRGWSVAASESISSEKSTATTEAPRAAALPRDIARTGRHVEHPADTAAASSSASAGREVIAPSPWWYGAARPSLSNAPNASARMIRP